VPAARHDGRHVGQHPRVDVLAAALGRALARRRHDHGVRVRRRLHLDSGGQRHDSDGEHGLHRSGGDEPHDGRVHHRRDRAGDRLALRGGSTSQVSMKLWRRPFRLAFDAVDRTLARVSRTRRVLVHVRTTMHAGILEPVMRALARDARVQVRYIGERAGSEAEIEASIGRRLEWLPPDRAAWTRIDLFVSADPWGPPVLRRCRRRLNFFHGVAGKYDLDNPSALPIGFEEYDRVAFINADRMRRYLANGIVSPAAA